MATRCDDRPANLAQAFDDALTIEEWWEDFNESFPCCPDRHGRGNNPVCGCYGQTGKTWPAGASRLLGTGPDEE